jgi:hypothetical protein
MRLKFCCRDQLVPGFYGVLKARKVRVVQKLKQSLPSREITKKEWIEKEKVYKTMKKGQG